MTKKNPVEIKARKGEVEEEKAAGINNEDNERAVRIGEEGREAAQREVQEDQERVRVNGNMMIDLQ